MSISINAHMIKKTRIYANFFKTIYIFPRLVYNGVTKKKGKNKHGK